MKRARHVLLLLVMAAIHVLPSGCSGLYSTSPRFSRRSAPSRVQPVPEPPVVKLDDPRQGLLSWPVPGPVAGAFGVVVDVKYGTRTRKLGIDIACAAGAPAKAAYPGRVSFADHFMGYGMTVIVDHGERLHTIYSRLKEISTAVGREVTEGQVLGYARDTLHFQVRKEGQSVDPQQWLRPR